MGIIIDIRKVFKNNEDFRTFLYMRWNIKARLIYDFDGCAEYHHIGIYALVRFCTR